MRDREARKKLQHLLRAVLAPFDTTHLNWIDTLLWHHGICSLYPTTVAPCVLPALRPPSSCCQLRGSPERDSLVFRFVICSGSSPSALAPSSILILSITQSKVLLVLYDGHKHAEDVPELLGTTENELGIRKWLEDQGHTLVTTSDKDRAGSKFDQELVDAEVIITTP